MSNNGYYAIQSGAAFMNGMMDAYNRHTAMMADVTKYENVVKQQNNENRNRDLMMGVAFQDRATSQSVLAREAYQSGLDPSPYLESAKKYQGMADQFMGAFPQQSANIAPQPTSLDRQAARQMTGNTAAEVYNSGKTDAFLSGVPYVPQIKPVTPGVSQQAKVTMVPDGVNPDIVNNMTPDSKERFNNMLASGATNFGGIFSAEGVPLWFNKGIFTKAERGSVDGMYKQGTGPYQLPAASLDQKTKVMDRVKGVINDSSTPLGRTLKDLDNSPKEDKVAAEEAATEIFDTLSADMNSLGISKDTPPSTANELLSLGLMSAKKEITDSKLIPDRFKPGMAAHLDKIAVDLKKRVQDGGSVQTDLVNKSREKTMINDIVSKVTEVTPIAGTSLWEDNWVSKIQRGALNTGAKAWSAVGDAFSGTDGSYKDKYGAKGPFYPQVSNQYTSSIVDKSMAEVKTSIKNDLGVWSDIASQYTNAEAGRKYVLSLDTKGEPTKETQDFINRYVEPMIQKNVFDQLRSKGYSRTQLGDTTFERGMKFHKENIGRVADTIDYINDRLPPARLGGDPGEIDHEAAMKTIPYSTQWRAK